MQYDLGISNIDKKYEKCFLPKHEVANYDDKMNSY